MVEIKMDTVMLINTVFFRPNSSVMKPEMCEVTAIPKKVTLDNMPLRNVSNSNSHSAGGMI